MIFDFEQHSMAALRTLKCEIFIHKSEHKIASNAKETSLKMGNLQFAVISICFNRGDFSCRFNEEWIEMEPD